MFSFNRKDVELDQETLDRLTQEKAKMGNSVAQLWNSKAAIKEAVKPLIGANADTTVAGGARTTESDYEAISKKAASDYAEEVLKAAAALDLANALLNKPT